MWGDPVLIPQPMGRSGTFGSPRTVTRETEPHFTYMAGGSAPALRLLLVSLKFSFR